MHPVIMEAVAAQQSRDLQAAAVAGRRARQIRRSRRAGQARGRWPVTRPSLRTPKAA